MILRTVGVQGYPRPTALRTEPELPGRPGTARTGPSDASGQPRGADSALVQGLPGC